MTASILKSKVRSFVFFSAFVTIVALAVMVLTAPTARAADTNAETKPAVIIDVRTPAEFAAGHIKGAINIPVDRIGQEIDSVQGIDKNSPILLYCRSGSRAERARQTLIQRGHTQVANGGGLEEMARKFQACYSPDC